MPMHIMVVFGTRPEGIKMMPVVKALRASDRQIRTTVIVTGQHREMLDQVFAAFNERPDIDLDLMKKDQTLAGLTANVLETVTQVLTQIKPDLVLVHGDTTTAMAAAVAGFYAQIPIGHVEAGLRSFDLSRPWPEEFNRVAVDAVAHYRFAPTESARRNLLVEYNSAGRIFVTGNTGIDALLYISRRIDGDKALSAQMADRYAFLDRRRKLVLVTGHRRESFGEGFERICAGLRLLAQRPDIQVVYPVHLNPRVRRVVLERLKGVSDVVLIDPVEYVDMVYLMKQSSILVTDSGGIQEEGPALGRPVLVMRDVTERPEALATGSVKLIGTEPKLMRAEVDELLDGPDVYAARSKPVFPYGDGTAARQIVDILERELSL